MELMIRRAQEAARATGNPKIIEMLPTIPPEFNPFWAEAQIIVSKEPQLTRGSSHEEPNFFYNWGLNPNGVSTSLATSTAPNFSSY